MSFGTSWVRREALCWRAETQLAIALDLGFLEQCAYDSLDRESYQVLGLLDRLLNALIKKPA